MNTPADIRDLRTRLVLEAANDVVDDTGALLRAWSPVTSVWGRLRPRRMEGEFVAGQEQAFRGWDIEVRWRPNIAAPMRFRIGQRAFHIRVALDPDARRRRLICRCDEAPV
jgi:SPP1 family predicted phage head-tail adaptor